MLSTDREGQPSLPKWRAEKGYDPKVHPRHHHHVLVRRQRSLKSELAKETLERGLTSANPQHALERRNARSTGSRLGQARVHTHQGFSAESRGGLRVRRGSVAHQAAEWGSHWPRNPARGGQRQTGAGAAGWGTLTRWLRHQTQGEPTSAQAGEAWQDVVGTQPAAIAAHMPDRDWLKRLENTHSLADVSDTVRSDWRVSRRMQATRQENTDGSCRAAAEAEGQARETTHRLPQDQPAAERRP
ncbi:hypothetical protein ACER0C_003283 [Sarotherodon galilaeus]